MVLHLGLHTYRADAVVRKAKLNMTVLLSLLLAGWISSAMIYRYDQREKMHQLVLAKQENLAKLGEMGAILAHEIRNPLGGIKGFAQVIVKKPTDERNGTFAQRIVAEATRLETLVTNLLVYVKVIHLDVAQVTIQELIDHSLSLIKPEIEEHRIVVRLDCPEGLTINADRNKLEQVMLNLLKNAVQAMPDGGSLDVTARKTGKQILIQIEDTGEGIEPDDLTKVFEPFFSTKAQGTGLGLALCKKIIDEHGGTITIKSTCGSGTTVIMGFPTEKHS